MLKIKRVVKGCESDAATSAVANGCHRHSTLQEAELAEEQRQREADARAAAIVAAEKARMLQEAAHLQPYLPRDVVQSMAHMRMGR